MNANVSIKKRTKKQTNMYMLQEQAQKTYLPDWTSDLRDLLSDLKMDRKKTIGQTLMVSLVDNYYHNHYKY
jgi:hypothetical protein